MVCLGNICCSPLGEGILKGKLSNKFIVNFAVNANYHARNATDRCSINVA